MDRVNCFVCTQAMQTASVYMDHLRTFHGDLIINDEYYCTNCDVTRKFSNRNSFLKHIKNHVRGKQNFVMPPLIFQNNLYEDNEIHNGLEIENMVNNDLHVNHPEPVEISNDEIFINYKKFLKEQSLKFLGKLNENYAFPRNLVDTVIVETTAFLSGGSISQIMEFINSKLQDNGMDRNSVDILLQMLNSVEDPFINFSSEYKRLKFFREQGSYIDPIEYKIGDRIDTIVENSQTVLSPADIFAIKVPMRQTLKLFFQIDGMLEATLNYIEELKTEPVEYVSNIINSVFWKSKLESLNFTDEQIVFPILFFNDDFEPNNPLGSHAGVHKMGGNYYSVPVIPPDFHSKLENIFLAGFYYSSDKKQYSNNDKIFKVFVNEINDLTLNGVEVAKNGEIFKIYFVLALVVGDNLGVNSMLGFTEGFLANHFCRFCLVHKNECQHQSEESREFLRQIEDYERDCASTLQESGINSKSIFNQVIGFHVYDNPSVDYMHDKLEGIDQYDLALILNCLIFDKKYFTLDILNDRINHFNYSAFSSCVNKPPSISLVNLKSKINTSAAESKTLVIFLGLMVGDLVPHDDNAWNLYIILRKILFLLISHTVSNESNCYLRSLIKEHHELYLELFDVTLKPKHHFLVHYPGIMDRVGPVVNNLVFRFEARHRQFKMAANATTCRINLCKTLAIKNQLNFCHRVFQSNLKSLSDKCGIYKKIRDDNCLTYLENAGIENIMLYCEYATINGTIYKPNMVLWYSTDEITNDPIFLKIHKILIQNNEPIFFCNIISLLYFDIHKQCFIVNIEDTFRLVELKTCVTVFPHYFGKISNENIVVLLK